MVGKMISLHRRVLQVPLLVVAGLFAAIHLVTAVVLAVARPDTVPMVSGYVLPVAAGSALLLCTFQHTGGAFEQALRLGRTRRGALGGVLALTLLNGASLFGLSALLTALERWAAPPLWAALTGAPGYVVGTEGRALPAPAPGAPAVAPDPELLAVAGAFPWWAWLAIAIGCALAGFVLGALMQRLGPKVLWGLWGAWLVWMLWLYSPPLRELLRQGWVIPAAGLAVLALTVWSAWSLLHAVVRR